MYIKCKMPTILKEENSNYLQLKLTNYRTIEIHANWMADHVLQRVFFPILKKNQIDNRFVYKIFFSLQRAYYFVFLNNQKVLKFASCKLCVNIQILNMAPPFNLRIDRSDWVS